MRTIFLIRSHRRGMAKRRTGNSIEIRGCLDRRTFRRQIQGRRRTRNHADERSAAVFLDHEERRTSWKINLARRLGATHNMKRSSIAMCPEGCFHISERRRICTNVISSISEETSFVRSLNLVDHRNVKRRKNGSCDCVER